LSSVVDPQGELINLALISWAKEARMAKRLMALASDQRGIYLCKPSFAAALNRLAATGPSPPCFLLDDDYCY
jgi:hypothetical protein